MNILTTIDGVPVFKSIKNAINWGEKYNLTGYHAHSFKVPNKGLIKGYMGGQNHAEAKNSGAPKVVGGAYSQVTNIAPSPQENIPTNIQTRPQQQTTPPPQQQTTPPPQQTPPTPQRPTGGGGY